MVQGKIPSDSTLTLIVIDEGGDIVNLIMSTAKDGCGSKYRKYTGNCGRATG
jgi:hypothetical protein